MTFLKTLMGALAVCAALLLWAGHAIGPVRPDVGTTAGLTAAKVLASDGMASDGRPGDPSLDRAALDRLVGAVSGGKKEAAAAGMPAG